MKNREEISRMAYLVYWDQVEAELEKKTGGRIPAAIIPMCREVRLLSGDIKPGEEER
jgi:hypothetical protein